MKEKFWNSPKGPQRLWNTPSQIFNGYEKGGGGEGGGTLFPRVKKLKCEGEYSPPPTIDTNNGWSYTPLHRIKFVTRTLTSLPLTFSALQLSGIVRFMQSKGWRVVKRAGGSIAAGRAIHIRQVLSEVWDKGRYSWGLGVGLSPSPIKA